MLGGYQVIDFRGETLETATTIKGAFKKAKSGKALLIENLGGISLFAYDTHPTDTTSAICCILLATKTGHDFRVLTITSADSCTLVEPA